MGLASLMAWWAVLFFLVLVFQHQHFSSPLLNFFRLLLGFQGLLDSVQQLS